MRKNLLSFLSFAGAFLLGWLALTSLAPSSWIANWAPCPRNWAWIPAWLPRASPLESLSIGFDGGHAKICYGSPALRGRTMIGSERVPYGSLWRTGANEPTTLHLDAAARLGPLPLLPGSYSIYTVPGERDWQVVVNRATHQWGLESEYDDAVRAEEVGRFSVAAEALTTPVESLTFDARRLATGAVEIRLEWDHARLRLPLVAGLSEPLDEPVDLEVEPEIE